MRSTMSSTGIWESSLLEQILIQTINGIVVGMILALVASGLTLIFGIMDVVNFAHGELFMLGAYVGAITLAATGNFWLALVAAALVVAVLGAAIHVTTLRPLLQQLYDRARKPIGLSEPPLHTMHRDAGSAVAVALFMERVDAERSAVREERRLLIARLLRDQDVAKKLRASRDAQAIYSVLALPPASAA